MLPFKPYEVKLNENSFYIPEEFFTELGDSKIYMLKSKENTIAIGGDHFIKRIVDENEFQNNIALQRSFQRMLFNQLVELETSDDILPCLMSENIGLSYGDTVTVKNDGDCVIITSCPKSSETI